VNRVSSLREQFRFRARGKESAEIALPKHSVFCAHLLLSIAFAAVPAAASTHVHLSRNASTTPGVRQYSVWRSMTSGKGNCNSYGLAGRSPCSYAEIAVGVPCCAYDDYAVVAATRYFYAIGLRPRIDTGDGITQDVELWMPWPRAVREEHQVAERREWLRLRNRLAEHGGPHHLWGGPRAEASAPRCTNYSGYTHASSIHSCDEMCGWKKSSLCSGAPGAGYTSTPTIQAVVEPLDMGKMYTGVPGSGLKPEWDVSESSSTSGGGRRGTQSHSTGSAGRACKIAFHNDPGARKYDASLR